MQHWGSLFQDFRWIFKFGHIGVILRKLACNGQSRGLNGEDDVQDIRGKVLTPALRNDGDRLSVTDHVFPRLPVAASEKSKFMI